MRKILGWTTITENGKDYILFKDWMGTVTDEKRIMNYLLSNPDKAEEIFSSGREVYIGNGTTWLTQNDKYYAPSNGHYVSAESMKNEYNAIIHPTSATSSIVRVEVDQDLTSLGSGGAGYIKYTFYDADGNIVTDKTEIANYIAEHPKDYDWYGDDVFVYTNIGKIDSSAASQYGSGQASQGGSTTSDTPGGASQKVPGDTTDETTPTPITGNTIELDVFSMKNLPSFTVEGQSKELLLRLINELKYIDVANATAFGKFISDSEALITEIKTSVEDVKATLNNTNSNPFNNDTNITYLTTLNDNCDKYGTMLKELTQGQMTTDITAYNEKLKELKLKARTEVSRMVSKEIDAISPDGRVNGSATVTHSGVSLGSIPSPNPSDEKRVTDNTSLRYRYDNIREDRDSETNKVTGYVCDQHDETLHMIYDVESREYGSLEPAVQGTGLRELGYTPPGEQGIESMGG